MTTDTPRTDAERNKAFCNLRTDYDAYAYMANHAETLESELAASKNAAKELPKVLTFGENNEWAVHHDDGCLIFHPRWNTNPHKTSTYIWREAWEFVQSQGGFDRLVSWFRDTKIKGGHTELKAPAPQWRELGPDEAICEWDEVWSLGMWIPVSPNLVIPLNEKKNPITRYRTRRPLLPVVDQTRPITK